MNEALVSRRPEVSTAPAAATAAPAPRATSGSTRPKSRPWPHGSRDGRGVRAAVRPSRGHSQEPDRVPNGDCVLFNQRNARVCEARPRQCRTWPFWAAIWPRRAGRDGERVPAATAAPNPWKCHLRSRLTLFNPGANGRFARKHSGYRPGEHRRRRWLRVKRSLPFELPVAAILRLAGVFRSCSRYGVCPRRPDAALRSRGEPSAGGRGGDTTPILKLSL